LTNPLHAGYCFHASHTGEENIKPPLKKDIIMTVKVASRIKCNKVQTVTMANVKAVVEHAGN
jgi:hypothetical protein